MSFFIDKHNRRKSPLVLIAFCLAILEMLLYFVLYFLLAEPLYYAISFDNWILTNAVHSIIVSLLGTAVCCLLFFLPDKRVAPYSFAALSIVLWMFYAAALLLDENARAWMLRLITMYCLAPVLIGNAVAWPIYLKMKRDDPALEYKPKTVRQELLDEIAKKAPKTADTASASPKSTAPEEPCDADEPTVSFADAVFGPENFPSMTRSVQEEAMLLYEDEEANDD